jgi:periplasmic protein TonB
MEAKKTVKADVHNKSMLFFSIGLIISLSMVLAAFEYRDKGNPIILSLEKVEDNMDEILDVPSTNHPPPPPKIQLPKIVEVPDDKTIESEIQITFDIETVIEPVVEIQVKEEEEVSDEIFNIVEQIAEPIGGTAAFYKYLSENIEYPALAKKMSITGRVFCEFVVNRDGTIQDVKVAKGIGAGCDEEAIRVLKGAPVWKPAKQRGKAVRSRVFIPIVFKE